MVYINGKELNEERVLVTPDYDFKAEKLRELSREGSGPYEVYYFSRAEDDPSQSSLTVALESMGHFKSLKMSISSWETTATTVPIAVSGAQYPEASSLENQL